MLGKVESEKSLFLQPKQKITNTDKDLKMEEVRDRVYKWTLELIDEGKVVQGLILMLSTWNFASFRYSMKEFPLKKFELYLQGIDVCQFKKVRFEDADLEKYKTDITELYKGLSAFPGIEYVGASKTMHFLAPNFFVMWDTKIRKKYKFGTSPESYFNFMKLMQKEYKTGKLRGLNKGVSIARAIDLYNLRKYSIK